MDRKGELQQRNYQDWHPKKRDENDTRTGGVYIDVVHNRRSVSHYIEPETRDGSNERSSEDTLLSSGIKRESSPELTAQAITSYIIQARESFLNDTTGEIVAYDLRHDTRAYKELFKYRALFPEAYEIVKKSLNGYTKNQIETHVGERHQVMLSTRKYEVRDKELYGEGTEEPFVNMIERGRDFCRKKSAVVDHPREDAEVKSFKMLRDRLAAVDAKVGQMELLVSWPGEGGMIMKDRIWQFVPSRYQHNFYDVFTLKEEVSEETGERKRYVESRRYSSGLDKGETLLRASEINADIFRLKNPTSVDLLSFTSSIDPSISKYKTAKDVHRLFHSSKQEFLSEEDFKLVLKGCEQFIEEYLDTLCDSPSDTALQEKCFKAVLNKAEKIVKQLSEDRKYGKRLLYLGRQSRGDFLTERDELGDKDVPFRDTGCGPSGNTSSFGLADAGMPGSNEYIGENAKNDPGLCKCTIGENGEWHFHCTQCGNVYVVTSGSSGCGNSNCGKGKVC